MMTETTPLPNPTPSPKLFRWGRLVLVISLALNLGILGMVAGAALNGAWRGGDPRVVRDIGFGPFTKALSEEDRKTLRRAFIEKAPDLRGRRQAMRDDMASVLTALRSDPFSGDQLEEALAQVTKRSRERQQLGEELLRDFVAALSIEDRLKFADRLEIELTRVPQPGEGRRPDNREHPPEP
ncbi:MAG: putative membrane protein [Pseudorhodobacter sp.]|jgi:uncharacterized membrane protein